MWASPWNGRWAGQDGAFLVASGANITQSNSEALSASPVGEAVIEFMEKRNGEEWTGTVSELLAALTAMVGEQKAPAKEWPKNARGFSWADEAHSPQPPRSGNRFYADRCPIPSGQRRKVETDRKGGQ